MQRKRLRPAQCEPGAMADRTKEAGERLRLSRERLMASDLKQNTRAWRLWAACVEATVGYTREADQTYVVGLARQASMERQVASKLLERFTELGVFDWRSGPRGSHTPGTLTLPSGGQSGPLSEAPLGAKVTPLHTNELSTKSDAVSLDTGTQRSPLIAHRAPDGLEVERLGSLPSPPETGTPNEVRPARCTTPGCSGEVFSDGLCIECDRARFYREQRFTPFHGDERTGDGIGDDEAAQVRWAGANPGKARARRQRDGGGHV